MFSELFLLFVVRRFHGERTVSGMYHLLKGKKSSQSIQDSYLYRLRPFYHSCDDLDRDEWQQLIGRVRAKGWIDPEGAGDGCLILSAAGAHILKQSGFESLLPDGLRLTQYIMHEGLFWSRLQLFVQTVSALCYRESGFIPVTRTPATVDYVRHCIFTTALDRDQLAHGCYRELEQLLSGVPDAEADCLAAQLSGAYTAGRTMRQMAEAINTDRFQCRMLFKSALRSIMNVLAKRDAQFPIIGRLLPRSPSGLSATAAETLRLLSAGTNMRQVAARRGLALSTIEDHLVEIALKDQAFDLSAYLAADLEREIIRCVGREQTRQLKVIKYKLQAEASYLQIRLALARQAAYAEEEDY